MNAPAEFESWLVTTLDDDDLSALIVGGIHSGGAPEGTAYPFLVFSPYTDPRDIRAVPDTSVLLDGTYIIGVVAEGASYGPADSAYDAMHGIIASEVATNRVVSVTRESIVRYAEEVDSRQYRHVKGVYRVQMTGA